MPRFVTQKELARTLDVTDRRVRQMEAEHIIPPASRDGRYDADLCVERYAIFSSKRGDGLARLMAEVEHDAAHVDMLVNDPERAAGTREAVQDTSRRVQALFATLRFTVVCQHRADDFPRQAMLETLERRENEALGVLLGRAVEVLAAEAGIPFEEASAQLAAQCAAEPAAAEA